MLAMQGAVADTYRAIRWLFVSSWYENDSSSLAFLSSHNAYTNYTEELGSTQDAIVCILIK